MWWGETWRANACVSSSVFVCVCVCVCVCGLGVQRVCVVWFGVYSVRGTSHLGNSMRGTSDHVAFLLTQGILKKSNLCKFFLPAHETPAHETPAHKKETNLVAQRQAANLAHCGTGQRVQRPLAPILHPAALAQAAGATVLLHAV
jgi:hypothetical protein